ncbi:MAG TPA: FISUMP domain-containing protein [Fibrobacteria bacterium]|nr:FISUMP domain-containing protein [Fibrobacteria bacterium]HOX50358.1 FISUMP domain-containing protein [Fibrobacteria bacterium]
MKISNGILVLATVSALAVFAACDGSSSTGTDPQVETPTKPNDSTGTVESGGKSYRTRTIGGKTWMTENLQYAGASGNLGSCPGNSQDSCAKYGRLYTWVAVMGLADSCLVEECADQVKPRHQGICPALWHVPADSEWAALARLAGGRDTAGWKLKAKPNGALSWNGADSLGFAALPAGYGLSNGKTYHVGETTYFWSSTETGKTFAAHSGFSTESSIMSYGGMNKESEFSLRCVRD